MFRNFEDFLNRMKGKTVNVVGLGVSNKPLIEILLRAGARVIGRDGNKNAKVPYDIELRLGDNYLDNLEGDYTFKSPGIRPDIPAFLEFIKKGGILLSEMEVFFDVCPCKIIGITGSDGKTTTTTLISELLKKQGYTVHIGGNIGSPLLPRTEAMTKDDICVVELSSFQLMTMKKSPSISVITNITPNHLDYHTDYNEYIESKEIVAKYQSANDKLILNLENDKTRAIAGKYQGKVSFFSLKGNEECEVYYKDSYICDKGEKLIDINEIKIPGMHNVDNLMAAYLAVKELIDKETFLYVARSFEGVAHRIEFVKEINGVKYYNDSIASSPTRTTACLNAFYSAGKKIILIAGGKDKALDFSSFGKEIAEKAKKLYLVGHLENPSINTAEVIKESVLKADESFPIEILYSLEETVKKVKQDAEPGDIVVLSPASTSFDKYKNFEERGNLFKEYVING